MPVRTAAIARLLNQSGIGRVVLSGLGGEDLEAGEQRRFESAANSTFHIYESVIIQHLQQSFDPQLWEGKRVSLNGMLQAEPVVN